MIPIRNMSYLLPMCCSFWEKCRNSQKTGLGCSTPLIKDISLDMQVQSRKLRLRLFFFFICSYRVIFIYLTFRGVNENWGYFLSLEISYSVRSECNIINAHFHKLIFFSSNKFELPQNISSSPCGQCVTPSHTSSCDKQKLCPLHR